MQENFSIQKLSIYIVFFAFCLAVTSIMISKNTSNQYLMSNLYAKDNTSYYQLEEDLQLKGMEYIADENITSDAIIEKKLLQEKGYIVDLIDPFDATEYCDGYVIYTYSIDKYKTYISCRNYKTLGYR